MNTAIFAMLNGMEIVLILAVILILFGAKKLPELAKGLGQGIKEFKKSTQDIGNEIESATRVNEAPRPSRKAEPQPVDPSSQASSQQRA